MTDEEDVIRLPKSRRSRSKIIAIAVAATLTLIAVGVVVASTEFLDLDVGVKTAQSTSDGSAKSEYRHASLAKTCLSAQKSYIQMEQEATAEVISLRKSLEYEISLIEQRYSNSIATNQAVANTLNAQYRAAANDGSDSFLIDRLFQSWTAANSLVAQEQAQQNSELRAVASRSSVQLEGVKRKSDVIISRSKIADECVKSTNNNEELTPAQVASFESIVDLATARP